MLCPLQPLHLVHTNIFSKYQRIFFPGEARFSKPQPATPWSEPRNASQAGAPVHWLTVCYQVNQSFGSIIQSIFHSISQSCALLLELKENILSTWKSFLDSVFDQVGGLIPFSSEDCLYLNVHVPVTQDDSPLPVMVILSIMIYLFTNLFIYLLIYSFIINSLSLPQRPRVCYTRWQPPSCYGYFI